MESAKGTDASVPVCGCRAFKISRQAKFPPVWCQTESRRRSKQTFGNGEETTLKEKKRKRLQLSVSGGRMEQLQDRGYEAS